MIRVDLWETHPQVDEDCRGVALGDGVLDESVHLSTA